MNDSTSAVSWKHSVTGRLLFTGLLVLLLMIPLALVGNLVYERQARQQTVAAEVEESWGRPQTIAGPVLTVPYRVQWKDDKGRVNTEIHHAHFLPEDLLAEGEIVPEIRYRGIYEVALYRVNLKISGTFRQPDLKELKIPADDILWEDSFIAIGMSDPRGIREEREGPALLWNDGKTELLAGGGSKLLEHGIHARLSSLNKPQNEQPHRFQFTVSLNGSENLMFVPVGKKTEVRLFSAWENPSFTGDFLPSSHEITPQGFKSLWQVSYLARSFPQKWQNNAYAAPFGATVFGVNLLIPVDFYAKSERAVKYGILFIVLTFMTFFLFETLNPLCLHPMQYLLVGVALCLFYLLLLSLSEHIGFTLAYLIAGAATIALISGYASAMLRSQRRGLFILAALTVLYFYLYILLHQQDYALLLGSLGLFLILAGVMYITRHVDWFAPGLPITPPPAAPPAAANKPKVVS
jgi:inner membrane protein